MGENAEGLYYVCAKASARFDARVVQKGVVVSFIGSFAC